MAENYSPEALLICSDKGLKIYAERSLSGSNTKTLLASVFAAATASAGIAVYAGAWPVGIFLIAMPTALTVAFSANNRDAKAYEVLRFSGNAFEIDRFDHEGRVAHHIALPAWQTSFSSEGTAEDGLKILAHGPGLQGKRAEYAIGAFLAPTEKEELLKLLNEARNFHAQPEHVQDRVRAAHNPELY